MNKTIEPTAFQAQVLRVPEAYDLFLGGGRGGGKSYALALLALRHVEQYREQARVLYVRRTYKSLADFELVTRDLFHQAYGQNARLNASEHVWRFPGGGYMELAQLDGPGDYSKFQGRSFTLLLIDECGEWPSPADLDRLRSNLRGPADLPLRVVFCANPGGPGHAWIQRRFILTGVAPWQPFTEKLSGRLTVYAPSTYRDNPRIDQEAYAAQLRASAPADPELLRAWVEGDWLVARGAYFGSCIEESRVMVDAWNSLPQRSRNSQLEKHGPGLTDRWQTFLAHDYGSAAPSVTYVCAESPGKHGPDGKFYPRGSIILLDELATVDPDDPNQGLGYSVPVLADAIREMCARWNIPPKGYADDAIFFNHGSGSGSIADEFRKAHVHFIRARKGSRIAGWQTMRRMLADAGSADRPGLYVSRACTYWWETVPFLARDPRRIEDLDSRGPDHAADASRYALTRTNPVVGSTGVYACM